MYETGNVLEALGSRTPALEKRADARRQGALATSGVGHAGSLVTMDYGGWMMVGGR